MTLSLSGNGTITGLSSGGLPDGSVDTADIANDAITLAKMASGTDGELITYDASGNPASVAVGTSGQVLTSNGAGNAPTMQDAGDNTPSFHVTGTTSVPSNTWTKIAFDTEQWDTDSAFDTSTNYRFTVPSGEGGKYLFAVNIWANGMNGGEHHLRPRIYKNGSAQNPNTINYNPTTGNGELTANFTETHTLADGDYIELYARQSDSVSNNVVAQFTGFKLAGV